MLKKYLTHSLLNVTVVVCLCLAFSIVMNGITNDIFNVPLSIPGSDPDLLYLFERNLLETGSALSSSRLGVPFKGELHDFFVACTFNFELLILRFILFFIPNVFIAPNIYYIILPALIGVIAFLVLQCFNDNIFLNMGGAFVYAFLPFYFMRNLGHFGLTTYQFVPLAFLLCIWGYQQKIFSTFSKIEFYKNHRNWVAIVCCILIANNGNAYWQAFSCFFILITGVLAIIDTKKWKAALPCFISAGMIMALFLMALYPCIQYQIKEGKNPEVAQRISIEPDMYGLKMSQMIIPYEIPGNTKLEGNFKVYLDTAPLTNENRTSYLGLIGTVGFLILLFQLLKTKRKSCLVIDLFTRLNVCAVFLATIGGFATIATVFIVPGPVLRGYNRISVYIAFMSIAAICVYASRFLNSSNTLRKYRLIQVGLMLLFCIHFVCLYHGFHQKPDYEKLHQIYQSDKKFISEIETSLRDGAMIYQLPYHKFPEGASLVNKMGDYQLLTGFLHSNKLRWSYGAMKGREGDKWQAWVASLPLTERVKVLSLVGFDGIYIDRRAYKKEELVKLEEELKGLLFSAPFESYDKNLVFYSMERYNETNLAQYTEYEKRNIHDAILRKSTKVVKFGASFIEKDVKGMSWQWLDKIVEINFKNSGDPYNQNMEFTIATGVSAEANLWININGELHSYKIYNIPTTVVVPVHVVHGVNKIEMKTDAEKVIAPADSRSMYMRLIDCNLDSVITNIVSKVNLK